VSDPPAVPLVRWDEARDHGAAVAVTTRHGGLSAPPYDSLNLGLHVGDDPEAVIANRARAAAAFGVGLDSLVFARQVHGTAAAVVGPDDRGRGTLSEAAAIADADILVTTAPCVTLVILVADCVPLALVDPAAGVLAAVHAGWRGTAGGAAGRALRVMEGYGARADRVRVCGGPAVRPDQYQVSGEVQRALAEAVHPAAPDEVVRPDGPGHWLADLVAANRHQLLANGIRAGHIVNCGTSTADEAFFSDRAQRPCGRFALLARLVP
jgi:polyphenol oxidase